MLSNEGLYLYRDNTWSLYGDISGRLAFSALSSIDGNFNLFLQLVPSGAVHILLNNVLSSIGIQFTGIAIEKIYFSALVWLNVNAMLFVSYWFLREHYVFQTTLVGSFFASLFFTFNPTAIMQINWSLHWTGYAFLPIVLFLSHKLITTGKVKYSVLLGLCVAFVGPLAHWLFFYTLIVVLYLFFNVDRIRRNVKKTVALFGLACLVFVGISSYFILPGIYYSSTQGLLYPDYVVTSDSINAFSQHSSLTNTIRLLGKSGYQPGDWDIQAGEGPPTASFAPYWILATFCIPLLGSISLLGKRNRLVLFFATLFLISTVLAGGSYMLGGWYYKLASLPIGWIFRVPTKWLWVSALSLSFLIGSSLSSVFVFLRKRKVSGCRIFAILVVIILLLSFSSWQLFTLDSSGITEPVFPPIKDINAVNDYLELQDDPKVVWMPFTRYHTWNNKAILEDFYTMSSRVSTLEPTSIGSGLDARGNNFLRFNLYEALLNNRMQEAANYLKMLGINYIAWHNDYTNSSLVDTPKDQLDRVYNNIANSNFFTLKFSAGYITLFEVENLRKFFIPQNTILVYGGLEKTKAIELIDPNDSSCLYVDQQITSFEQLVSASDIWENPNTIDIIMQSSLEKVVIDPFSFVDRETPSELWSKGSVLDPWEADWHKYLANRGITNWQFDYNKGIAFTWANGVLKEPSLYRDEEPIFKSDFEANSLEGWKFALAPDNEVYTISIEGYQGEHYLKANFSDFKNDSGVIRSPLIPAKIGDHYRWELSIRGNKISEVDAWMAEYNENGEWINSRYIKEIGKGDFDWNEVAIDMSPESLDTAFISLDIAPRLNIDNNGLETNLATFSMDTVKVYDMEYLLESNLLELPFRLENANRYDLFVRCFKSGYGGRIFVDVDLSSSQPVNTYDEINGFFWEKIGDFQLSTGNHKLIISNDNGFNAVNLLMLVPHEKLIDFERQIEQILENKKAVYVIQPETDMYCDFEDNQISAGESGLLEMETNSQVWRSIQILEQGEYTVSIRANGNFKIEMDDRVFWFNSSRLQWTNNEACYLEKGMHEIRITAVSPSYIETLCVWSNDENETKVEDIFHLKENPAVITSYQMNDATKYSVNINATKPFMLSFNEKYDPLWVATVNGKKIESIPLDSTANGFWINQTGQLRIVIEYEPQKWFYYGSIISAATLIVIGMLIILVVAKGEKM